MRVYTFKDRFASLVKAGNKRQTIRPTAKCKPGDLLSLRRWSGRPYRSKQEILLDGVICTGVYRVSIYPNNVGIEWNSEPAPNYLSLDAFAQADGFADYNSMLAFFSAQYRLPFNGALITWAFPN